MPRRDIPGSGTLAIDHYRETEAAWACNVLLAGYGLLTRSTDHSGAGELCTEVIVRLRADTSKRGHNVTEAAIGAAAVHNLRAGFGHHKAQAAHTGSNTCAQVLAAATN